MKNLLAIFFLLTSYSLSAQVYIYDAQGESFAYLKENVLLDSSHQVRYNLKGQIIFDGISTKKEDIKLTVETRKNKTLIYQNVETNATWLIQNNSIYWRKNRTDYLIANVDKKAGFTSIYNAASDSLIAYINAENVSDLELSFAFFHIWNTLGLENVFNQQTTESSPAEKMPDGIVGYMKPVYGDPLNVWLWDGAFLYPAYDNDPRYVWKFDGETIKPNWNSRIETEWSWDGSELRPYWGGHPKNNWRWEGNIFRQIFENNYRNEFEIVDGVARKRFGTYGEIEWEVHGEMPLALISVVLLRIVYR